MSLADDAREAGSSAVSSLRVELAKRVARVLQRDPDLVATAIEVGLVDRDWLERPGETPVRTTSARDVLKRFVERSAERHPSTLAQLGVSAVQVLSWNDERDAEAGPSPMAVAFTDLEGFTRFTDQEGDEAALELINRHHAAVGPVVRGRGGRVVKRLGDGLLLTFPEAEAAVLCGLDLLATAPEPLRLRAGVHFGDAAVTRDDVIGRAVNVAARVTEAARGDEVLATGEVRDRVGELHTVRFAHCRRRSFKGVGDPVEVCRVERQTDADPT
jgi:adenylate cyclase